MQEWLDNNDILMYLRHNEGKSVIAERFIKTLKFKIYKKNNISYEILSSKLLDEYNNTYQHSIDKKPINNDYSASAENIESNTKAPKFIENDRIRFTKYEDIFR